MGNMTSTVLTLCLDLHSVIYEGPKSLLIFTRNKIHPTGLQCSHKEKTKKMENIYLLLGWRETAKAKMRKIWIVW